MKTWLVLLAAAGAMFAPQGHAQERATRLALAVKKPAAQTVDPTRYMRVYGTSLPPYAFVELCQRSPELCLADPRPSDARLTATPARMRQLDEINRSVNRLIQPFTDSDLYGVADMWILPSTKGDCEDYALLKRKLLVEKGWPLSSLLITVVRDEKGEGHAILTARLSSGDYILDNKVDDLKLWTETPYQYVMRQSYLNPRVWMSLDPRDATPPGTLAGLLGIR